MCKETWVMEYEIIPVQEHFEIYADGKFVCSADTIEEVAAEIEKSRRKEES